jgi:phosphoglycolate phosphatase
MTSLNQHLLSAYEQNSLNKILEKFGITKYFKNVVGLDNIYAGGKKILAEKLAGIINSNGRNVRLLMIGDTLHDLEVAQHIKSDCILVACGHQSRNRLRERHTLVFNDMEQLKNSISINGSKI